MSKSDCIFCKRGDKPCGKFKESSIAGFCCGQINGGNCGHKAECHPEPPHRFRGASLDGREQKICAECGEADEDGNHGLEEFILPPDAQFVATEVDGAVSVHVGIGDGGFTMGGDREALRSLASMILHSLDDNCPQCMDEVRAAREAVWCQECGDGCVPHNPGVCGTCYDLKYRKETKL